MSGTMTALTMRSVWATDTLTLRHCSIRNFLLFSVLFGAKCSLSLAESNALLICNRMNRGGVETLVRSQKSYLFAQPLEQQ